MKPIQCEEVDRGLWRYLDRELSAGEISRISAHLKQCTACSVLHQERAREARQYRLAFSETPFGDKFAGKLRRRMLEEGLIGAGARKTDLDPMSSPSALLPRLRPPRATPGSASGWRLSHLHRGRRRRFIAVAAMLLLIPVIVAIGLVSNGPSGEPIGYVSLQGGGGYLSYPDVAASERPAAEYPFSTIRTVYPGARLRIPEGGTVTLHLLGRTREPEQESAAVLKGPAVLRVDRAATRKELLAHLDAGDCVVTVSPRVPGETFEIWTPHARAAVVGTQFELAVSEAETRLAVREGKVQFRSLNALPGDLALVTASSPAYLAGASGPVGPVAAAIPSPPATNAVPDPGATAPLVDPEPEPAPAAVPPRPDQQGPPVDLDTPVGDEGR